MHNLNCSFEKKIKKQLAKRGWTEESVKNLVTNPHRTVQTRDNRWKSDGSGRRDDPATAFIDDKGHYVVRNDLDGSIVPVSNINDPNWQTPF
ncbi:MAG: colicin E5-related ribonuclease [Candidatus Parabeggiatoa sp.]|nr:colicin E5-related ribonuclease [Candidatus Parabeggiatoa sp.]